MKDDAAYIRYIKDRLKKTREGLIEGIRQEVERRRRLGIPLYVDRDGVIQAVILPKNDAPQDDQKYS